MRFRQILVNTNSTIGTVISVGKVASIVLHKMPGHGRLIVIWFVFRSVFLFQALRYLCRAWKRSSSFLPINKLVVTSSTTSTLIFSLAATVYRCYFWSCLSLHKKDPKTFGKFPNEAKPEIGLVAACNTFLIMDGACAHYVMVSKFQWKPFWLATQRDPQNDWTATQNGVNYDVFAQAPLCLIYLERISSTIATRSQSY